MSIRVDARVCEITEKAERKRSVSVGVSAKSLRIGAKLRVLHACDKAFKREKTRSDSVSGSERNASVVRSGQARRGVFVRLTHRRPAHGADTGSGAKRKTERSGKAVRKRRRT